MVKVKIIIIDLVFLKYNLLLTNWVENLLKVMVINDVKNDVL
jgi:hypothetical protein